MWPSCFCLISAKSSPWQMITLIVFFFSSNFIWASVQLERTLCSWKRFVLNKWQTAFMNCAGVVTEWLEWIEGLQSAWSPTEIFIENPACGKATNYFQTEYNAAAIRLPLNHAAFCFANCDQVPLFTKGDNIWLKIKYKWFSVL